MQRILNSESFTPLKKDTRSNSELMRPTLTYWQDAFGRLRTNKLAVLSLTVIAVVFVVGVIGPLFFPHPIDGIPFENQQNSDAIDQLPSFGDLALVTPDTPQSTEDTFSKTYQQSAGALDHVSLNLAIIGEPTVDGVSLSWTPHPHADGYQIDRVILFDETKQSLLTEGVPEVGLTLVDIKNPAQISYTDGLGLDPALTYAYVITPYLTERDTGIKLYAKKSSMVKTNLLRTIPLSSARSINPGVIIGDKIPSRPHIFGTDSLGRDIFARMIVGTRINMLLALLVPMLTIFIGVLFGAFSGLIGGKVDTLCMRFVEIIDNFPDLLIFIMLQVAIGKGVFSLTLALTLFSWAGFARLVRGEVLKLREFDFVKASHLLGGSVWHKIIKHLAPNLLGIILIAWSARIPGVIAAETFLSMLGLGIEQPTPSWGNVVFDAAKNLQVNPLQFFLPASVLAITLLAFYILGDALRDAFDPKLRGGH